MCLNWTKLRQKMSISTALYTPCILVFVSPNASDMCTSGMFGAILGGYKEPFPSSRPLRRWMFRHTHARTSVSKGHLLFSQWRSIRSTTTHDIPQGTLIVEWPLSKWWFISVDTQRTLRLKEVFYIKLEQMPSVLLKRIPEHPADSQHKTTHSNMDLALQ